MIAQEIVSILDIVIENENRGNESVQTVLDKIAMIKKTILVSVFRGGV